MIYFFDHDLFDRVRHLITGRDPKTVREFGRVWNEALQLPVEELGLLYDDPHGAQLVALAILISLDEPWASWRGLLADGVDFDPDFLRETMLEQAKAGGLPALPDPGILMQHTLAQRDFLEQHAAALAKQQEMFRATPALRWVYVRGVMVFFDDPPRLTRWFNDVVLDATVEQWGDAAVTLSPEMRHRLRGLPTREELLAEVAGPMDQGYVAGLVLVTRLGWEEAKLRGASLSKARVAVGKAVGLSHEAVRKRFDRFARVAHLHGARVCLPDVSLQRPSDLLQFVGTAEQLKRRAFEVRTQGGVPLLSRTTAINLSQLLGFSKVPMPAFEMPWLDPPK